MADYIRVSIQQLVHDKDTIQGELGQVVDSIEQLREEMTLLGQTWEGPAWETFQNQVATDIENMQMVCSKIKEFLSHMEYAEKEYRVCEDQVRRLVDEIRI